MQKIINQLEHVFHLMDTHASQSQLSVFTLGEQALNLFVSMVVRDVRKAFTQIDSFVQDYELVYGQQRISLLQELDGIVTKLIIYDLAEWRNNPKDERFKARVTELGLACMNAKDLIDGMQNEEGIQRYNGRLTYLPSRLYLSKDTKDDCRKSLSNTKLNVKDVINQMEKKNDTFELASSIKKNIIKLKTCINEMGGILLSAKEWFDENEFATNNTADILDYKINSDYNTTLAPLNDTVARYKTVLHDLAEHKITKLQLQLEYINKDKIEDVKGYLKTSHATIKKQLYTILENAIDKVEKESISAYHDVMSHLSRIQQYYTKGDKVLADQARQMYIFYKPYIFEDSFGSIEYTLKTGTDTYEIWPLNKDFKEFADKEARDRLATLVKNYFKPVHDAMSKVMDDIQDDGDAASESLQDFMESLALYAKSSMIDQDFIQ